jgi:hypothetical protein
MACPVVETGARRPRGRSRRRLRDKVDRPGRTTPPKAGWGRRKRRPHASGRRSLRAPHGLVCLTITTAGPRNRRASPAAADASSTLLYDSALPWSGGSPEANGPSAGRGSRSVRRYRAARWCGFSPYRRVSTLSSEIVSTAGTGRRAAGRLAGRSIPPPPSGGELAIRVVGGGAEGLRGRRRSPGTRRRV